MRIEILIESAGFRRWHQLLADRIARLPGRHAVGLRFCDGPADLPSPVTTLLALERLLAGGRPTLADRVDADVETRRAPAEGAADIVIDCREHPETAVPGAALVLRPLYDGVPTTAQLAACILSGAWCELSLEDGRTGAILARARPSAEAAAGLSGGIESVVSRLFPLVERVLARPEAARAGARLVPRSVPPAEAARFLLHGLAHRAVRSLYRLSVWSLHWRIGWRFVDGPGVLERGDLAGPPFRVLADPGHRFFADPFPVTWAGRTFLFFEDLDHRVGKGVISAIEFGPDGPIGAATPVIEEPWHLSYPFLIEDDGALYMVPEASLSGQVTLYRCIDFPHRWEKAAVLLEGIEAADATILRHAGRYWMMSATREGLGGYSDILRIHHAPRLTGPWSEHALTPVLVDVSAARPAGAVVMRNGGLWRPVQDCRRGYGKALCLARIDRLDPDHFEQTILATLGSGPLWPGGRLHTLNRVGRLEVIDGTTYNPRLAPLRRLVRPWMEPRAGTADAPQSGLLEGA